MLTRTLALLVAALLTVASVVVESAEQAMSFSVLVFSKTAAYRHQSIPAGIDAIRALGAANGFEAEATESAALFTDDNLKRYRVVVFLNTSGDVLGPEEQAAFERFIQHGGGFVGVHSATDTEYDWPWYGRLVGAYFLDHPAIQEATLIVDRRHSSTAHLPAQWTRTDEWYNFRALPGSGVQVLIRLDETTYSGGKMGANHPMAWHHEFDGGRAWYTALGHTDESYSDPNFRTHLLGGIRWAAGVTAN